MHRLGRGWDLTLEDNTPMPYIMYEYDCLSLVAMYPAQNQSLPHGAMGLPAPSLCDAHARRLSVGPLGPFLGPSYYLNQ
jgi:hypothetical protein